MSSKVPKWFTRTIDGLNAWNMLQDREKKPIEEIDIKDCTCTESRTIIVRRTDARKGNDKKINKECIK